MNRKFKVFGLALVAVMAMSAVVASAASATNFTAASYPVNLHGEQPAGNLHVFSVGGGEVECETATFSGVGAAASSTQTITPNYGGAGACEAFGFLGATVNLNGCDYMFHAEAATEVKEPTTHFVDGKVDVVCPTGKEITITDNLNICNVHVKPQVGVNGITYENNGNHVDVTAASNNIHAVVTGAFCPIAAKTYANATYSGKVTLKGNGGAVKIDVG